MCPYFCCESIQHHSSRWMDGHTSFLKIYSEFSPLFVVRKIHPQCICVKNKAISCWRPWATVLVFILQCVHHFNLDDRPLTACTRTSHHTLIRNTTIADLHHTTRMSRPESSVLISEDSSALPKTKIKITVLHHKLSRVVHRSELNWVWNEVNIRKQNWNLN